LGDLICVPEGRHEITGTVLGLKEVDGYIGGTVTKMLFRVETDEGWYKVFGSLPMDVTDWNTGEQHGSKHQWNIKGQRLTLRATLQPKEKGFGFFKNPRSCKWLP
jgi:hypothetical protein